ncbi:chromosome segregation protein SMC [Jeotgalibacillus proteolyticus]|uniref:Chromosome partition protein Smc n=1 Tax=Jeotgalibacillus proteolyticus TaxID=2082395 RepID=A0A2S5GGU3_9BACL|nr:chromosome segregation protein SMC [Jeotgalibacillus proteolyticus]PPA72083.1 chromosome segregation protein SMC [Jeotgalibacillus proteolyticus]
MFLKRVEILGFKSFAEKIGIDFVPGVTAVVGPNGSGKSNITDAIRWVLGEQSAKSLRGGKMEDIIFAGSDSRKPVNLAEVTLILDNEDQALPLDYVEVSVTRRVYRSGDSEYLLNNQPCRLKDIVDLFIDSGLGKEAFSIIGQGRVEQILNSKPEERRVILEEAAGVLKYKSRRKKADMRLVETQENLYRVQDILHELEGQVEPLKIQASLAKEYLEKMDELKKTEAALLVHDVEQMNQQLLTSNENYENLTAQEEKKSADIKKNEQDLAAKKEQLDRFDRELEKLQADLLSATKEAEQLEGRRQVLLERKKNASQNEEQMKKTLEDLVRQITATEQLIHNNLFLINKNADKVKGLQAEVRNYQKEVDSLEIDIEEQLEQVKNDYFDAVNEKTTIKNELSYADQQLEQHIKRASRLQGQNAHYINERTERLNKQEFLSADLEKTTAEIKEAAGRYTEIQNSKKQLSDEFEQLEKKLYKAYQYLSESKSRKNMLETMEDDFSGFFQGVKEILKARTSKLKGIEGAVAELLSVDKKYETAIETALGGSMQSVVTATEKDARQAISYLKQNRFGRATFLPMSVIKPKSLQQHQLEAAEHHDSFIGVASSLTEFDTRYAMIIQNLLGNVLIVKDLKGANDLAARLQHRFRFVTVDGDIVNPGGSMTGGAQTKKGASLLSRKNELDQLTDQIPKMEETALLLEKKIKEMKLLITNTEVQLDEMRSKGEALRIKESEIKSLLRETELSLKRTDDQLSMYDLEMGEFEDFSKEINEKKNQLTVRLNSMDELIGKLNDSMKILTEKKDVQRSSKDELLTKLSASKSSLAVAKEQQQQLGREKESLSITQKQLIERKNSLAEDIEWIAKEKISGEDQTEVLKKTISHKQQDRSEALNSIEKLKEIRLAVLQESEQLTQIIRELTRLHKGLLDGLHDEKIKLNRLEVEIDTRLKRLLEEYELSFHAAKEAFHLQEPPEDARRNVKLIKMAIEELGRVNLGAIEEYERVSERYEFLLEQQNDLLEAKQNLQEVIEEMDGEMSRRFGNTFNRVKAHFTDVFKELFGGGRAELKLTDPDDLLNSGVEIVAQPPGKKLQHLGLMSGGERALTAIALLFSILKVRPVPFCILDEVEAALDEANVHRFSQYLHRFSQQSQFIVITHRKGTMEGADVLYGITMQESGVSKLVSVRLEEQDPVESLT